MKFILTVTLALIAMPVLGHATGSKRFCTALESGNTTLNQTLSAFQGAQESPGDSALLTQACEKYRGFQRRALLDLAHQSRGYLYRYLKNPDDAAAKQCHQVVLTFYDFTCVKGPCALRVDLSDPDRRGYYREARACARLGRRCETSYACGGHSTGDMDIYFDGLDALRDFILSADGVCAGRVSIDAGLQQMDYKRILAVPSMGSYRHYACDE